MVKALVLAVAATGIAAGLSTAASAAPSCVKAERHLQEASALRFQARQEARLGNHDRVCDTLDEVGDKFHDAQDAFEDCGADIVAIDLRSELRTLRVAKRVNRCD